ncbi:hypothetical protein [Natrinema sp. 1APR25-10V2]|uniref:hypothetical protein n=1 Tax=Natrinema sp. 1APR25-10V2 TaxID=2951081 RepID=UPI0028743ED7|nr:hypothetical protein [Natrinema sp. 1APR25-10V2]MDS0474952.1 hypothetical protein [Natrinema sp. 1APR25-10V2]
MSSSVGTSSLDYECSAEEHGVCVRFEEKLHASGHSERDSVRRTGLADLQTDRRPG